MKYGLSWRSEKADCCIDDVMRSILPEDLHGEIPVGFNTAGHVGSYPDTDIT